MRNDQLCADTHKPLKRVAIRINIIPKEAVPKGEGRATFGSFWTASLNVLPAAAFLLKPMDRGT